MNYGYIRVSTDKQSVENQKFEIQNFCAKEKVTIDGWIEETISGVKSYDKRKLGTLLSNIQKDDRIICSEISRLGRSLYMIMEILSRCMSVGAFIWTIKGNFRLGDTIDSKVLAFAFGLSAEVERDMISQRTIDSLKLRRSQGIALGRPKLSKLTFKESEIVKFSNLGISITDTAKYLKVSRSTLQTFIKDKPNHFANHRKVIA
jgi:DNA invertase Pin-like site-specific DNA recombinase